MEEKRDQEDSGSDDDDDEDKTLEYRDNLSAKQK
jgi:hypothetical protein